MGATRNDGIMYLNCKVMLKPLSVNKCWQGRRFKTQEYKMYEKGLLSGLPNAEIPDTGEKMMIYLRWGFSSTMSDWDNPIKPFQDILQKKYGFDDRHIHIAVVEKTKVRKGEEYIFVQIKKMPALQRIREFIKELFLL